MENTEGSSLPPATATLILNEVGDYPPTDKPSDNDKPKRPGPAQLLFRPVGATDAHKAIKYPMPLKAARFHLTINGDQCEAAQTTFGEIRYTYFMYNGASFYVPGHHQPDTLYEFTYPEGYKFQPLKLDRRAQSEAAAKAKAAKAAANPEAQTADAGAEPPPADANDAGEGGSYSPPAETLQEAPAETMSGKKSKRSQR
jgi:hypothetical protein